MITEQSFPDDGDATWLAHRRQCEEGVIGGVMAEPSRIPEVAALTRESDFVDQFLGSWFRIACELFDADQFSSERLRGELRAVGYLKNVSDLEVFATLCDCQVSTNVATMRPNCGA